MQDQLAIGDADRRLLGALGARDGCASPAELREATGLPPRTLTRALGRLDAAGLLAERSKRIVTLSAPAWCLLQPASRPDADLGVEQRHRAQTPAVFRARARSDERASTPPAREAPRFDLGEEEQLDVDGDEPAYEDEWGESPVNARGGFWTGFLEGLERPAG